jgi:signal transduction histidine kinase
MNLSPEVTGLGLPISKPMFELLDGELTLESQLNQGTTIRILFPETSQIV